MRPDRVIKLPVFRAMFKPVARKAWKCNLCKAPVTVGERYIHYVDRRIHKIINYRFHMDCFGVVEAYCMTKGRNSFTPITVQKWAKQNFCANCAKDCPLHPCAKIKSAVKTLLKKIKKSSNGT